MRNTTIFSSIASVVSRVFDIVLSGGNVRRTLPTSKRERMGNWLEKCSSLLGLDDGYHHQLAMQATMPGYPGGTCPMWHRDIAQALSTPTWLTSGRAQGQSQTQG